MNHYPETPDNWIERQPEDDGPQIEDACIVCDKIECVCPPESETEIVPQDPERSPEWSASRNRWIESIAVALHTETRQR